MDLSRIALAFTLAIAVTAPAVAQSHAPQKPKAKAARIAPKPDAPLICTKYGGCQPLPANCRAEMEVTWAGPTGFQFIVCP